MTDREPDDLYDALRDRLADFGQEPPAPLWAGIRAQLPPPVARPQLRSKRRWASVALLLLLLTTASGVGWHWWHTQALHDSATHSQAQQKAIGTEVAHQKSDNLHTVSTAPAASAHHIAPGAMAQTDATTHYTAAGSSPASNPNTATTDEAAQESAYAAAASPATATPAADAARNKRAVALAITANAVASRRSGKQQLNEPTTTATATTTATTTATATAVTAASAVTASGKSTRGFAQYSAPGKDAIARNSTTKAAAASWWKAGKAVMGRAVAARRASSSATAAAAEPAGTLVAARTRAASSGLTVDAPVARSENQPAQSVADQAATATAQDAATGFPAAAPLPATGFGAPGKLAAEELARMQAQAVALRLAAGLALPQPQPTSVEPNKPPTIARPRWAVQVLAGPALTYRHMSGSGQSFATTPNVANPLQFDYSPANAVELERSALGSGAQLNVRRALTERWNLSAGLGYAEYATQLALQHIAVTTTFSNVATSLPRQDSTVTSIHRRDTYRFVTVPVRVGYTWPLATRWSVGLLAGAEAAVYVGGSTNDGLYQRVSVGASLGTEVRYRLNGRWELLAQPTATYMLTPLVRDNAAAYQRHLLGGTAWLGAAYTLP